MESEPKLPLTDTVLGRLQVKMDELGTAMDTARDAGEDVSPIVKAMRLALPGMIRRMANVDEDLIRHYCLVYSVALEWVANGDNESHSSPEVGERTSDRPLGVGQVDSGGTSDSPVSDGLPEEPDSGVRLETEVQGSVSDERDERSVVVQTVGPRSRASRKHVVAARSEPEGSIPVSVETPEDSIVSDDELTTDRVLS
jgi:hypothetical protein